MSNELQISLVVGLILAVMGWIVTAIFAFRSDQRAARSNAEARAAIASVPEQVEEGVRRILAELHHVLQDVRMADVDGDGKEEILVEGPAGAAGRHLVVFKADYKGLDLLKLGEFFSEAGGFDFQESPLDGRRLIVTGELDWDAPGDLSHVEMPRIKVVYQWDGKGFREVSRTKFE